MRLLIVLLLATLAGCPAQAGRPADACWEAARSMPHPANCDVATGGCPCSTNFEILCDTYLHRTLVCVDGWWEASAEERGCTPGSCLATPDHVGCPCCVFEERCLWGGSGIACRRDRWSVFHDGPCWPSVDAGPRDSGPPDGAASMPDASVRDDADPMDGPTDASDAPDAPLDDASDAPVEDSGTDGG